MGRKRPAGIVLVAIWMILGGLWNMGDGATLAFAISWFTAIAAGLSDLIGGPNFGSIRVLYSLLGIVSLAIGVAKIVLAWGVLEGKQWARQWGIVALGASIAIVLVVIFPFIAMDVGLLGSGLSLVLLFPAILDALALVYLLSREAKAFFGEGLGGQEQALAWAGEEPTQVQEHVAYPSPQPTIEPPASQADRTQFVRAPLKAVGWLVIDSGTHRGQRFALTGEHVIGRDPSICDLVLSDPTVSRQHAKIRLEGKHFYIYDLGSTSGTKVNGRKTQRSQLMDNDRVRLGNTTLIVKVALTGGR